MSQQPFFGVVENSDGTYLDLYSGSTVDPIEIKKMNRQPMYGRFIDKDGVEHDLRELINRGGTGGGIEDAPYNGKQHARKDGSWSEITNNHKYNFRGLFVLGNTYNKDDIVIGDDGNEYLATMSGVVLPPPSMGWDLYHPVYTTKWGNISGDIQDQSDLMAAIRAEIGVIVDGSY